MRAVSSTFRSALYAQETTEILQNLLTVDHDDLGTPIRLTNNTEDVTSRSNTYTAVGFTISIPPEVEGELPRVKIAIDNVNQALVDEIRSLTSPPTLTLELVLASDPDTVEVGPYEFVLKTVDYDQFTIEGSLGFEEDLLTEPIPSGRFTPTDFPGLFNALS